MCKYSLEGYKTRKAVKGETLVANMHSARLHGVLTKAGTRFDGTLTCVVDGSKLTIEKLETKPEVTPDIVQKYYPDAVEHLGQRVVAELVDGRGVPCGMDSLRFGKMRWGIPLAWLKYGTEVYVGDMDKDIEKSLAKKLKLDAKTLRGVAADLALIDPNPKPEDAEEKREEEREKREKEQTEPKQEVARVEYYATALVPSPVPDTRVRNRFPLFRTRS